MNSSISPRTTHVVSTHGWRGIPEQWYGAHQMCCAGGRCAVLVGGRLGTPWRIHDPGMSQVRLCVCMQSCLTLLLPRVQESVRCHTLEWISACRVECRLLRAHPWPVNGRPGSGTGIAATAGGASCDSQSSGGSRLASSSPLRHSMRRVLRRLQQRDRQATAQPQPREQLSPRGRSLLHPSQPLSPVPESPPAHPHAAHQPQPHQGQVDQATPERRTRKRPRIDDRRITLAPDSEELDDLGDEHGAVGRAGQRGAARAKRARQEVAWLKEQNRRRAAANRRWQQRQQQIGFQISTNSNAYNVWMNPFPLMPNHVVIAACEHVPQAWSNCKDTQGNMSLRQILSDFGETAQRLPGHVGFYNGVNAGASIPGHLHFQFFSRLSGHPVFPLEQCKFSDPTSAGEPRFSLGYPVPVALWRGPAKDVISNAGDWIADWEERNTHRRDSLSCNMIVASEDGGRTIALYFVPRISKRQWWNGDKGIVGGVELLGELVMASHEECAMVENGEVDYAFIESALGAVYTPFETN